MDNKWQNEDAGEYLGYYLCAPGTKYRSEKSSDELSLERLCLPETNLKFSG